MADYAMSLCNQSHLRFVPVLALRLLSYDGDGSRLVDLVCELS
jgi:hypothetical protein